MKQCTELTPKQTFAFKVNGKGRAITFKEGQRFWVTNTEPDQNNRKVVNVARHGKPLGCGYDFTPEQVAEPQHRRENNGRSGFAHD